MKNKKKIPWQGITLGIIYILIIIAIIGITIGGLTTFLMAFILSQSTKIGASFMSVFPIILAVAFISIIIFTLFVPAVFSGKRWSIILTIFLAGSNFLMGAWNILKFLIKIDFKNASFSLLGLMLTSFIIWLALSCLKHPFYGGSGQINGDSFKFWKRRSRNKEEMTTF